MCLPTQVDIGLVEVEIIKGVENLTNFNEIHSLFQMKKVFLKKIVIAEN